MISFQAFSLSNWILSSCGHSLSFLNRNSGPFHHLLSETNPLADVTRDRISAGFWLPGQNLHDSRVVCARISCTLLMTYCFQGLKYLIQHKTVIEWTKNTVSNFWGKAFCTVLAKRTRIVAPYSSSLGMLCFFNGSTFSLPFNQFYIVHPHKWSKHKCLQRKPFLKRHWNSQAQLISNCQTGSRSNILVYKHCCVSEAQEWVISIPSSYHP